MERVIHGIVHGKTIELREELGVADGQAVELLLRVVPPATRWGEGIRESAGGWANYPEMDDIMEQIQQHRKLERSSLGED